MVYSKEPNQYLDFWKDERELLTERNKEGYRAIDAGPVILGERLSNTRTGYDITRRLIYPKGAYILHMVRMMMWDRKNGDQLFRETMQDFVKTYANKVATTEDFKTVIEKHMTPEMDLLGIIAWIGSSMSTFMALPCPGSKFEYSFAQGPKWRRASFVQGYAIRRQSEFPNARPYLPGACGWPHGPPWLGAAIRQCLRANRSRSTD